MRVAKLSYSVSNDYDYIRLVLGYDLLCLLELSIIIGGEFPSLVNLENIVIIFLRALINDSC